MGGQGSAWGSTPRRATPSSLPTAPMQGEPSSVTPLNGSNAASDLGLYQSGATMGNGSTLIGTSIAEVTADIQVTMMSGVKVDIDLSNLDTVQDVLSALNGANSNLVATINSTGTGINLTDTAGGSGSLSVVNMNGSLAGDRLGLTSGERIMEFFHPDPFRRVHRLGAGNARRSQQHGYPGRRRGRHYLHRRRQQCHHQHQGQQQHARRDEGRRYLSIHPHRQPIEDRRQRHDELRLPQCGRR